MFFSCKKFTVYRTCKDFDLELVSVKNFSDAIQSYDKNDQRNLMTRMKALEEYPFEEDRLNNLRETFSGNRKFSSEYAHVEKKRQEMASSGDRRNNNGCLVSFLKLILMVQNNTANIGILKKNLYNINYKKVTISIVFFCV